MGKEVNSDLFGRENINRNGQKPGILSSVLVILKLMFINSTADLPLPLHYIHQDQKKQSPLTQWEHETILK